VTAPRLTAGTLVAGAYVADRLIGQGASGEVWAASHAFTREHVALKVLAIGPAADDECVERFRREAMFLERVASDRVARIVDFVCDATVGPVLVLELVDGEPLAEVLDRRTLSVEEAVALGAELLEGVGALHAARVIHRDLKPGNVLLRAAADGARHPVICDFGLSRLARSGVPFGPSAGVAGPQRGADDSATDPSWTELTRGDVAMGTLKYMAPEQVLNARQATERSDLYAVGAILYRAVTGAPPFGDEETPRGVAHAKVIGEAPPCETGRDDATAQRFAAVVMKALRRRPGERYADAASMRAELAQLCAGLARLREESGQLDEWVPSAGGRADDTQRAPTPIPAPPPDLDAASPAGASARMRRAARARRLAAAAGVALVFAAGVATGRIGSDRAASAASASRAADARSVAKGDGAPAARLASPPLESAPAAPEDLEAHLGPATPTAPASAAVPPAPPSATVALAQRTPAAPAQDADDNPY